SKTGVVIIIQQKAPKEQGENYVFAVFFTGMRAGAASPLFWAALSAHSESRAVRPNRPAFPAKYKQRPAASCGPPKLRGTYLVFFGVFTVFVVLAAALAGFSALTSFTARLTGAFASFSTSVRTQSWFSPLTNSQ